MCKIINQRNRFRITWTSLSDVHTPTARGEVHKVHASQSCYTIQRSPCADSSYSSAIHSELRVMRTLVSESHAHI